MVSFVEVDEDHILNAKDAPDEPGPVLRRVDEGDARPGDHAHGMGVEREHGRRQAARAGNAQHPFHQGGVADVHTVEKPESDHAFRFFHITPRKSF
jgi:hypothetical protein